MINCVGIGNAQGVRIPIKDRSGNVEYKKDKNVYEEKEPIINNLI